MPEITIEETSKLKWAAVKKIKDSGYSYTVVQCQSDGSDLVFKISGTYRKNPLKKYFLRVKDWQSYTWNDIALRMIDFDCLTRHINDALLQFYSEHRNERLSFLKALSKNK